MHAVMAMPMMVGAIGTLDIDIQAGVGSTLIIRSHGLNRAPVRTQLLPGGPHDQKGESQERNEEDPHNHLVAAATAAAAAASTARGTAGRSGGAAVARSGENGELDSGFLAGALRAGDFLLLVDDDFFELILAVFANVFVNWHLYIPRTVVPPNYSRIGRLPSGSNLKNRLPPRGVYLIIAGQICKF
jgi:hypothetical protein